MRKTSACVKQMVTVLYVLGTTGEDVSGCSGGVPGMKVIHRINIDFAFQMLVF